MLEKWHLEIMMLLTYPAVEDARLMVIPFCVKLVPLTLEMVSPDTAEVPDLVNEMAETAAAQQTM